MAKTNISWAGETDNVFITVDPANPSRQTGWYCTVTSPGCRNCYAQTINMSGFNGLGNGGRYAVLPESEMPVIRYREEMALGWKSRRKPRRIFLNSMTDTFLHLHSEWWVDLYDKMAAAGPAGQVFFVLTKHEDAMVGFLNQWMAMRGLSMMPDNIWSGVSAENQKYALRRVPRLAEINGHTFVSFGPLIGAVDPESLAVNGKPTYDWAIVEGESGENARPMHPDWVRPLLSHSVLNGVPFVFKQWGEWGPADGPADGPVRQNPAPLLWLHTNGKTTKTMPPIHSEPEWRLMLRFGKKAAGCSIDGAEWLQIPESQLPSDDPNLYSQLGLFD